MSTYLQKPADVQEKWYLVNAEGKTLGRLAARVAGMLRGKHRPTFTPNVDMGDHVVIINAEKIHLSGDKMETKLYRHHQRLPGRLKDRDGQACLPKRSDKTACRGDRRHVAENAAWQPHGKETSRLCGLHPSASGTESGTDHAKLIGLFSILTNKERAWQ